MKKLIAISLLGILGACALSPVVDKTTDTTLAERCELYYKPQHAADIAALEAAKLAVENGIVNGLSDKEMQALRLSYSLALAAVSFSEAQLARCPVDAGEDTSEGAVSGGTRYYPLP